MVFGGRGSRWGNAAFEKMQILSEKRLFLKTEKSFCNIGPAFTKVKTMQDYFRSGFILNFIISAVFSGYAMSTEAEYSVCTGIMISSAATMAVSVSIPESRGKSTRI